MLLFICNEVTFLWNEMTFTSLLLALLLTNSPTSAAVYFLPMVALLKN